MMGRSIIKFMLLGTVMISSCYYDSVEKLYPSTDCVTTNMSLQTDIEPILERNCYVCHSSSVNSGNVTLDTYSDLMVRVNDGSLLGAINHNQGFTAMPQNAPKLASCEIAKIEQWITDGAQNN